MKYIHIAIVLLFLVFFKSTAAPLKFVEQTLHQPDGSHIAAFASGDEFYHWLHDKNGYTIIRNPNNGYFVYATLADKELVPSTLIPGIDNPSTNGLEPWLKISKEKYQKRVEEFSKPFDDFWKERRLLKSGKESELHQGELINLLVFITFKDGADFNNDLRHYNQILNTGSISLNSYYREISYNKLNFTTHFFPQNPDSSVTLSYTDFQTRNYYRPYNATSNTEGYKDETEKNNRLQVLLKNALESIQSEVPASLNIDKDKDGFVDNISFVVQGNPDGWNDLIWPHRYALYAYKVMINGAQARLYTFQMENTSVKTFCHEMFHMLGAPDLYHYDEDQAYLQPVGNWDLMESGFGHMGAYMKYKYSEKTWLKEMPVIDASGIYSLHPLSSEDKNCFIIYPRQQFQTNEYFVLEYRNKLDNSYENNVDDSGLLLYRIKPDVEGGNRNGPPDEVYIYRPNGAPEADGSIKKAAMKNIEGYAVLDNTAMSAFLTDGRNSGLKISNISDAGDSITFEVDLNLSMEADILSFTLQGSRETSFDTDNGVIYIQVERETNLESARPNLTVSEFASVTPESNAKVDLTNSPFYTVTAEDGSTKEWLIDIEVLPNTEANFTSFAFVGLESNEYININNQEVIVKVPYGTSLKNLVPTATVSIGAQLSPDTLFPYDFNTQNIFTIISEDLATKKEWNIKVQPDENAAKFKLEDLVDIYSEDGYIIIESFQEDLSYEIFSLNGSLVNAGNLNGRTYVDVYGKQGVYIVRVKNDIGTVSGKIRVEF